MPCGFDSFNQSDCNRLIFAPPAWRGLSCTGDHGNAAVQVGYVAFEGLPRRNAGKCRREKTTVLFVLDRMNRNLLRGTLRGMIGQKRKNPK